MTLRGPPLPQLVVDIPAEADESMCSYPGMKEDSYTYPGIKENNYSSSDEKDEINTIVVSVSNDYPNISHIVIMPSLLFLTSKSYLSPTNTAWDDKQLCVY